MRIRSVGLLCVVSAAASGCIVPEDAKARVGLSTEVASKFVHRGMTQVDRPVFQPSMSVAVPTVTDDEIRFVARGNMDLTDDNGDAWFPRGHAGRFSEVDFIGSYQKQLNDTFTVRAGIFNYNLPNGLEFSTDGRGGPGEERGGTTEVFVTVSANVLETTPYFSWHYDFDEVRAAYYRAGITETFSIDEEGTWSVVLDGSIGYTTSGQADWLYDLAESGLADLRGKAELRYKYDARTLITAGVHGSAMMNSTLDRWFIDVGIPDDDPIWFSLGCAWSF